MTFQPDSWNAPSWNVVPGGWLFYECCRGLLGVVVLLAIMYALSLDRRRVNWRLVAGGISLAAAGRGSFHHRSHGEDYASGGVAADCYKTRGCRPNRGCPPGRRAYTR